MVILLLSNKWDLSVDYIVQNLKKKNIQYLRINTEDLITKKTTISFPSGSLNIDNKLKLENLDVKSILLRRPGKPFEFETKRKPSKAVINYVSDQWQSFLSGLQSLSNVLWINNPIKNAFAETKINQLSTAKQLGFKIPKTRITNDINVVKNFWNHCEGKMIVKSLSSPLINEKKNEFFIFTNKVKTIDDMREKEIILCPSIFQEALINKIDFRVTVVGNQCFVVKIVSKNSKNEIDWRRIKNDIKFRQSKIPEDIKNRCIKLVSELGLTFGAIDLVKVKDEYYFLEINPNGEWGWLQKNAKLPIAETITEKLIEGKN